MTRYIHLKDAILAAENYSLNNYLKHFFGYYLVQIDGNFYEALHTNSINCKIYCSNEIHVCVDNEIYNHLIEADFDELPILSNSIDVVILPHSLERLANPEFLLQEVYRILIPEGKLLIIGFNPISLFGLTKLFQKDYRLPNKLISIAHLRELLNKNDLTLAEYKTFFFRPPLLNHKQLQQTLFMEAVGQLCWPHCGGIYIGYAQKRVTTLIPFHKHRGRQKLAVVNPQLPVSKFLKNKS